MLSRERTAKPAVDRISSKPEPRSLQAAEGMPSNQALQRLLHSGAIRAKLTVGQPGDPFELEADRTAERVMRKCTSCCPECAQKEEETVQTKPLAGNVPEITPDVEDQIRAVRQGGNALPTSERAFFEPRFGRDFSGVRIHTGPAAAESARTLGAAAYTLGHDIVFAPGRYSPGTDSGRRLMAHELTHVVQQSPGQIRRECDPPPMNPCPTTGRHSRQQIVLTAFQTASNWLPNARLRIEQYMEDPGNRANRRAAQALRRHFSWTEAVRSNPPYPDIPQHIIQVIDRTLRNITVPIQPACPSQPRLEPRGNDHMRVFASSPGAWERSNCYEFYPDFFTRTTATRRAKTALHEMMHSWENMRDIAYDWEGSYPPHVRAAQFNADSFAALIRDLGN